MFTRHSSCIIQKNGLFLKDLRDIKTEKKRYNRLDELAKDELLHQCETSDDKNRPFSWNVAGHNRILINGVLRWFESYRKQWNGERFIVLQHKDSGDFLTVELHNRFSKSRQKKIKKRISWLAYHYGQSNCVMLTLTLDPKKFQNDKFKMWEDIKKEQNRFLTALKYYFEKRGIPFPKYLSTIESMEGRIENGFIGKGLPHLHIVFIGATRLLDWRKIRDLWGLGHIWINRTSKGKKIRNPLDYVAKYITKTYTDTSEDNRLSQALCWLFKVRSYSCTRGLIYPLGNPSNSIYKPLVLGFIPVGVSIKLLDDFYSSLWLVLGAG